MNDGVFQVPVVMEVDSKTSWVMLAHPFRPNTRHLDVLELVMKAFT